MPRPQQQQPSPARVFVRSLLPFSPLRASSLSWNSRRKRGEREGEGGGESSFLPADSLLSLSTLSLPVCFFLSLSIAVFFGCIIPRPFPSGEHATFSFLRSSLLFFFLSVVSSHTLERRPDLFLVQLLSRTVANKCIECKLPTNFFHRFVLALRVHARACISLLGDICSQLFHNEIAQIRTRRDFTKHFRSHCYYRMRIVFFCLSHLPSFILAYLSYLDFPNSSNYTKLIII